MIIGWFFMVSQQTINADSNWAYLKSMTEGLTKAADENDDPLLIYVFLPHDDGLRFERDGFAERFPNVKLVPLPMPSWKNLQSKHFHAERVYQQTRRRGIGVYWNNIPEIGAQLSYLTANYWAQDEMTPGPFTLTYNHYTIHDSLPYAVQGYDDLRITEILGNYLSDVSVFNSEHNERMLRENAEEFGLSHWIDELDRNGKLARIPIPVLDDELQPHLDAIDDGYSWADTDAAFPFDRNGDPGEDGPLVYYNHRLQAYKQWRDTFDVLDSLWSAGTNNWQLWLSYGDGDYSKQAQQEYPFIRLQRTHTHDDYYQQLRTPHFNTINTVHETFCIAMVESALLGGIPIVPDRVTFPEIFPDDYEFMFSDGDEQHELLHNALTGGWSEAYLSDEKRALRDHFSQYNVDDIGELAYDELHGRYMHHVEKQREMLKDPDKVDEFFTTHAGGWTAFTDLYNQFSRTLNLRNQAVPQWRFMALLEPHDHDLRIKGGTTEIKLDT